MERMYQKLLNSFDIDIQIKEKVKDLILSNEVLISSRWSKNGIKNLAIALLKSEVTYQNYLRIGIPEQIFFDTMKDIEYWVKNSSGKGLKNYSWIKNHLNMNLFKIGILQFQMVTLDNTTLKYKYLPFKKGENVIYIHIPQGKKLLYDDCKESIVKAKEFFRQFYPDFDYSYFFSESWLLFDGNKNFMDKESNIIKFQSLFDIKYSINDGRQAKERIFGNKTFANMFDKETSLQKSTKEYIKNKHNKLGVGIGIINKEGI